MFRARKIRTTGSSDSGHSHDTNALPSKPAKIPQNEVVKVDNVPHRDVADHAFHDLLGDGDGYSIDETGNLVVIASLATLSEDDANKVINILVKNNQTLKIKYDLNLTNITNYGTIQNVSGTINISGIVDNEGTITNYGKIVNNSIINNYEGSSIDNDGTFTNNGTINNDGSFINENTGIFNINGKITNESTNNYFENDGKIYFVGNSTDISYAGQGNLYTIKKDVKNGFDWFQIPSNTGFPDAVLQSTKDPIYLSFSNEGNPDSNYQPTGEWNIVCKNQVIFLSSEIGINDIGIGTTDVSKVNMTFEKGIDTTSNTGNITFNSGKITFGKGVEYLNSSRIRIMNSANLILKNTPLLFPLVPKLDNVDDANDALHEFNAVLNGITNADDAAIYRFDWCCEFNNKMKDIRIDADAEYALHYYWKDLADNSASYMYQTEDDFISEFANTKAKNGWKVVKELKFIDNRVVANKNAPTEIVISKEPYSTGVTYTGVTIFGDEVDAWLESINPSNPPEREKTIYEFTDNGEEVTWYWPVATESTTADWEYSSTMYSSTMKNFLDKFIENNPTLMKKAILCWVENGDTKYDYDYFDAFVNTKAENEIKEVNVNTKSNVSQGEVLQKFVNDYHLQEYLLTQDEKKGVYYTIDGKNVPFTDNVSFDGSNQSFNGSNRTLETFKLAGGDLLTAGKAFKMSKEKRALQSWPFVQELWNYFKDSTNPYYFYATGTVKDAQDVENNRANLIAFYGERLATEEARMKSVKGDKYGETETNLLKQLQNAFTLLLRDEQNQENTEWVKNTKTVQEAVQAWYDYYKPKSGDLINADTTCWNMYCNLHICNLPLNGTNDAFNTVVDDSIIDDVISNFDTEGNQLAYYSIKRSGTQPNSPVVVDTNVSAEGKSMNRVLLNLIEKMEILDEEDGGYQLLEFTLKGDRFEYDLYNIKAYYLISNFVDNDYRHVISFVIIETDESEESDTAECIHWQYGDKSYVIVKREEYESIDRLDWQYDNWIMTSLFSVDAHSNIFHFNPLTVFNNYGYCEQDYKITACNCLDIITVDTPETPGSCWAH